MNVSLSTGTSRVLSLSEAGPSLVGETAEVVTGSLAYDALFLDISRDTKDESC